MSIVSSIGLPRKIAFSRFGSQAESDSGSSTHNWTAIGLPAIPPSYLDRYIVCVVLGMVVTNVSRSLNSVTIGGVACTEAILDSRQGSFTCEAGIFISNSPINAGVSAAAAAVFSGTMSAVSLSTYGVLVPKGRTLSFANTANAATAGTLNGTPISQSFRKFGCVIGGAISTAGSTMAISGTGITQDGTLSMGSGHGAATGSKSLHDAATGNVNISSTDDGSAHSSILLSAAFELAA